MGEMTPHDCSNEVPKLTGGRRGGPGWTMVDGMGGGMGCGSNREASPDVTRFRDYRAQNARS